MTAPERKEMVTFLLMLIVVASIWLYMTRINTVTPDPFRVHRAPANTSHHASPSTMASPSPAAPPTSAASAHAGP
jgi:hypothetical protein